MERVAKSGIAVLVGTIFTADAPDYAGSSPTVQDLHSLWGLGPNPFAIRREEDIAAVRSLGADYIFGDILDSIYRRDSEGNFLYLDRKARFSTPSPKDEVWIPLRELLVGWIGAIRPSVVLCPLAVGRHVDHHITSEVLRSIKLNERPEVFLYEDMPYSAGFFPPDSPDTVRAAISRSGWTVGASTTIPVDAEQKIAAVMEYKSQITRIFPHGRDVEQELKRYMLLDSDNGFKERLWSVQ